MHVKWEIDYVDDQGLPGYLEVSPAGLGVCPKHGFKVLDHRTRLCPTDMQSRPGPMKGSSGTESLWLNTDDQAYLWLTEKEMEKLSEWEEKVQRVSAVRKCLRNW